MVFVAERKDFNPRIGRILLNPPAGKKNKYPSLNLTVIHANELSPSKEREPIAWKPITNLQIDSPEDAIEKLEWYSKRWSIETFHKILKSGFKAENSKLRSAERLANLIAIYCVLIWRIFWMTMINRIAPKAPPCMVFTRSEIKILDKIDIRQRSDVSKNTLAYYLLKLAKIGGYLARANDPPPGNMVLWRGMSRLNDICLGFNLAGNFVGN